MEDEYGREFEALTEAKEEVVIFVWGYQIYYNHYYSW
jgi:hypothetical protein